MNPDIMMDGGYYSIGAKFTMHVADLLKNGFFEDHDNYMSPLSDYPIFEERYRDTLNTLIIDHFLLWEIGQETETAFWYALRSRMWEIMPKYNVLFRARDGLTYDPLKDHDYSINHNQTGTVDTDFTEGKSSNDVTTSNATTTGRYNTITRDSDTPQQNINNLGYGQDDTWINQWLTHGQIVNNDHTDTTTARGTDDYTHSVNDVTDTDTTLHYLQQHEGRRTSGQELALKLAELAFDIETQILTDLSTVFMNLYDN